MPTFREDTKIGGMVPLIKTDDYSDRSVTEKKLADGAITTEKLSKNVKDLLSAATGLPDDLIDSVGSMDSHFKDLSNRFPVKGSDIDVNAVSYDKLDKSLIVGQKGDSERSVMSQGAVSRELDSIESNIPVPDEEDLTSIEGENNKLRFSFADRSYSTQNFSGKGYKILRKNIKPVSLAVTKIVVSSVPTSDGYLAFIINGIETHVDVAASTDITTEKVATKIALKLTKSMVEYEVSQNASTITITRKLSGEVSTPSSFSAVGTGASCIVTDSTKIELRNILTPDMINRHNTIYEIRYDFDLDGETIEIKEGCTLKFEGGQLHNGVIVGDNLFIDNELKTCLNNVTLRGTFKNDTLYPEWFGTAGDGITDDEPILNKYILPSFRDTNIKKISFSNNHYCANTIYLHNLENKEIDFGKSTFIGNTVANGIGTVCGVSGNNLYVHGGIFKPRFYRGVHNGSGADNGITIPNGKNIVLDNVTVDLTEGAFRGIDIQSAGDCTIDGLIINNCTTYGGENGIDILTGHNNKIKNVTISNCNIYNAYQGILINAGYYSLTIDNITISNCNIYNSEWIGMDIRYVKDLIVSKCRVQDSQYRGISIYTSNFDIKDCFVSCKDNVDAEKGVYIYDDSSASEIDLTTIFSSIDNLIVKGAFKVGFETKQDYIRVTNLYLEGYINYGIANNRKKCFYKNIFYLSDKEVYLPNYEKGYGIIIEDIYKLSKDRNNEKNSNIELPSALKLNYLGGLLIPNSDGTFYKIATRNNNLTLRSPSNEDILTLFPDKTATFGGMLRVAIGGLYFINEDKTKPIKLGFYNGNMCFRNSSGGVMLSFQEDKTATFGGMLRLPIGGLYFNNEDGKNPIKLGIYNGRMTFRDSVTNDILLSFDDKGIIPHSYSSDNRPQNVSEGYECYDSTLKKKILWNGTAWVNVDGSALS